MTNTEADNLIATIPKPRSLKLYRDGDQIVMAGGRAGTHSIAVRPSSAERLLAHWQGYVENQGLSLGADYSPSGYGVLPATPKRPSKPKARSPRARPVESAPKPLRIHNVEKFEALLDYHRRVAKMWKEDAAAWKADPTARESADEERRAREFAKEHDRFIAKLVKIAQTRPDKLVDLTEDPEEYLTPADLQLTNADVFGKDEDQ